MGVRGAKRLAPVILADTKAQPHAHPCAASATTLRTDTVARTRWAFCIAAALASRCRAAARAQWPLVGDGDIGRNGFPI